MHNHIKTQQDNQPIREHFSQIDQPQLLGGRNASQPNPPNTILGGRSQHISWAIQQWVNWKIMTPRQQITKGLGILALIVGIILLVRYFLLNKDTIQKKHIHYEFF